MQEKRIEKGISSIQFWRFMRIKNELREILEKIQLAGGQGLVVGGSVRDYLIDPNIEPKDLDVEVYRLSVDQLVELLQGYGKVDQVGKSFGVIKLTTKQTDYDFSLPRTENKEGKGHTGFMVEVDPNISPKQAARRRDFTINSIAYDPLTGEFIDHFGGEVDLRFGYLIATSKAFSEDPLRVLRGMQFAGRFNLIAVSSTLDLCKSLLSEYKDLSKDRVWGEWYKWATKSVKPSKGLNFLDQCGWLTLYPELEALKGVEQDSEFHPEGWSLTELPVKSALASPTQATSVDLSLREFLSCSSASDTTVKSFGSAPGAKTISNTLIDSFSTTAYTTSLCESFSPSSTPAVVTQSKSLMWFFGAIAANADPCFRVMFKVPFCRVQAVVGSSINDFEVVKAVVKPIAIYMMNVFPPFKSASDVKFHDDSVDTYSSTFSGPGSVLVASSIVVESRSASIDSYILFTIDFTVLNCDTHSNSSLKLNCNAKHRLFEVTVGDVFIHTQHVVDAAARICARESIIGYRRAVIVFAALCHDLGKPSRTDFIDGRWRSRGHEQSGVEPTKSFLDSIGSPKAITDQVIPLVERHLAHLSCGSSRSVRRLAGAIAPATIEDLVLVIEADHSGRPPLEAKLPERAARLLELAKKNNCNESVIKPILLGRHLIDKGHKPGKEFKGILSKAFEAQLDGEFDSLEGAVNWLEVNYEFGSRLVYVNKTV